MASKSEILQEFLVALGFRIDARGQKGFVKALEQVGSVASATSGAIDIASNAIEKYVINVATQLEKLYYVSERTGATATNIMALGVAAGQIGLTAESVTDTLEGFARALREKGPGMMAMLHMLGVKVTGRDMSDVMIDFVNALKSSPFPFYLQSQFAGVFGMSGDTLLMMENHSAELRKIIDERKELQKNAGITDADASAARDFSNQWKLLGANIDIVQIKLEKYFLGSIKEVVSWMDKLVRASSTIGDTFDHVSQAMADIVLAMLGQKTITQRVAEAKEKEEVALSNHPTGGGVVAGVGNASAPLNLRQNNPGNLRSWGSTPIANGFAIFSNAFDGLSAMAGNLLAKTRKHGLDTIQGIIGDNTWGWAPPGENNSAAYISDVARRMGVSASSHLNLSNPNTMLSLMDAITRHEGNGTDPYSADLMRSAIGSRLGGGPAGGRGVNVTQTNNITVNGSSDPNGTANAIGNEQNRVNSDLLRNLGGAIR